jgi:hypothetical protein
MYVMDICCAVVLFVFAAVFGVLGTWLAGQAAYSAGHQISDVLAQFSVLAVIVISIAKFFGAACAAWSKSTITRCAGGVTAALCAAVIGCASWSTFMSPIKPQPLPAGLLPIWVVMVVFVVFIEVVSILGLILGEEFREDARARRGRPITA